jgi:hypothetical protein
MIQGVESSVDFGIVRMKEVLEHLSDDFNKLVERSYIPFVVRRIASCKRGAFSAVDAIIDCGRTSTSTTVAVALSISLSTRIRVNLFELSTENGLGLSLLRIGQSWSGHKQNERAPVTLWQPELLAIVKQLLIAISIVIVSAVIADCRKSLGITGPIAATCTGRENDGRHQWNSSTLTIKYVCLCIMYIHTSRSPSAPYPIPTFLTILLIGRLDGDTEVVVGMAYGNLLRWLFASQRGPALSLRRPRHAQCRVVFGRDTVVDRATRLQPLAHYSIGAAQLLQIAHLPFGQQQTATIDWAKGAQFHQGQYALGTVECHQEIIRNYKRQQ